jgi:hypothetical protein
MWTRCATMFALLATFALQEALDLKHVHLEDMGRL